MDQNRQAEYEGNRIEAPHTLSLNCRGRVLDLEEPLVMGILNLTPDSFSDGGKFNSPDSAYAQVKKMLNEGADIIDIGGYSSRPDAVHISEDEELSRIYGITQTLLEHFPSIIISIDTFRSGVAKEMLELGVHIINDISSGNMDPRMMETVGKYDGPYIAMHMQGTPQTMQKNPEYSDVVEQVWDHFLEIVPKVKAAGITDLVIDPGFGFGKSILHNYQLLGKLEQFLTLELPILVGVSRKSMLYKLLDTGPDEVLPETAILHSRLLDKGAHILRVHDVATAKRCIQLHRYMKAHGII